MGQSVLSELLTQYAERGYTLHLISSLERKGIGLIFPNLSVGIRHVLVSTAVTQTILEKVVKVPGRVLFSL